MYPAVPLIARSPVGLGGFDRRQCWRWTENDIARARDATSPSRPPGRPPHLFCSLHLSRRRQGPCYAISNGGAELMHGHSGAKTSSSSTVKWVRRIVTVGTIQVAALLTTSAPVLAATHSMSGSVACENGGEVNGIWLQSSAGGSVWADYSRRSTAPWVANYSKSFSTSASSTQVELHIGCAGSTGTWGSSNKTTAITVSGPKEFSARCNDVKGKNGYRCRRWSNGTVLVGMPFSGGFDRAGLSPATSHPTQGHVSTDLYASSGTPVKAFAYGHRGVAVTLKTAGSPTSNCGNSGESVQLDVFWDGSKVGWFRFAHLKAIPASIRQAGTVVGNGTTIGTTSTWPWRESCWEVTTASGVHTHYTGLNTKEFACMAPYSQLELTQGRWIGLVGLTGANSTKEYCAA